MWALRRASKPLRRRVLGLGMVDAFGDRSEITFTAPLQLLCERRSSLKRFYDAGSHFQFKFRCLSFQTTLENREDGELENMHAEAENVAEASEDELELSEADTDPSNRQALREVDTALSEAILSAPRQSIQQILDNWVKEGKKLEKEDFLFAIQKLHKLYLYRRALQLWQCLEESKQFDFTERDFASQLNLIAKVHGLKKAEDYIRKIPESLRKEIVYRTLLFHYVSANDVEKAEKLFNKMRNWRFPISSSACDQMLLLYSRNQKNKTARVLSPMEKQNVKFSACTYRILLDAKARLSDRKGMEKVIMTMKADGIEPNNLTKAILAKYYASFGMKERAKALLEQISSGNLKKNRWRCKNLLRIYAMIGEVEEVKRVWKICGTNPFHEEATAAIEAWGMLNKVEEAENILSRMLELGKKPSLRQYNALLRVYADRKMVNKANDLVKRMDDEGIPIGPSTWNTIVRLYQSGGEIEKAYSILQKMVAHQKKYGLGPFFVSFLFVMEQFAKTGDVRNTEMVFQKMRELGYTVTERQYLALIQAYVNARAPAYGMRERIRADKLLPSRFMERQLARVDPFKKSLIHELLE